MMHKLAPLPAATGGLQLPPLGCQRWPGRTATAIAAVRQKADVVIIDRDGEAEEQQLGTSTALQSLPVPQLALGGATGFAAIAFDVFHPSSLHLLSGIDHACHQFVAESLSPQFKTFWADIVISDTIIALGVFGWFACTVAALWPVRPGSSKTPEQVAAATAVIVLAWAIYLWGAGPVEYDPYLVDCLKNVFERHRPSDILQTFSFPSGHTSSASFLAGSLLFVLLPVVLPPPGTSSSQQQQSEGRSSQATTTHRNVPAWLYRIQGSWPLWALSCGTTAAGRVLADAHWLSDTLAATCLGAMCVAGLAAVARPLASVSRYDEKEVKEEGEQQQQQREE